MIFIGYYIKVLCFYVMEDNFGFSILLLFINIVFLLEFLVIIVIFIRYCIIIEFVL